MCDGLLIVVDDSKKRGREKTLARLELIICYYESKRMCGLREACSHFVFEE